jgi:hypothetical protein
VPISPLVSCLPRGAEIHNIVGAGKSDGAMDASNLLKPMLARGELRCIGATTLDEYRQYIEKDPALERYGPAVQRYACAALPTCSNLRCPARPCSMLPCCARKLTPASVNLATTTTTTTTRAAGGSSKCMWISPA